MTLSADNVSKTDLAVLWSNARWALALTWQTNRLLMVGITLVTLLISLMPAALAVAVRGLVNAVAAVMSGGTTDSRGILLWLGLGFAISLVDTVGGFANTFLFQRLNDELNLRITRDILKHAASLDLAYFEDPHFQDMMELARQSTATRFSHFVSKTLAVITNVMQMVSLTVILVLIEPLIIVVLLVVSIPYLHTQWRLAKSRYAVEFGRITKQRWTRYFVTQMTSRESVPEVKLLRLSSLLMKKFDALMTEFNEQNRTMYRQILTNNSLFAVLSSIAFYGTFARVALRVIEGGLTIGDVAVYGGAMARLRGSLSSAILSLTSALEQTLHISNLKEFLSIEPGIKHTGGLVPAVSSGELLVKNVTFTYPGVREPALHNISLHIRPGETIALVGRNGAGKTTLVKLLARLYSQDEGCILLDGVDVRDLSLDYLHRQVSFVFQHFGRYEATAAENIAYGDWQQLLGNQSLIEKTARLAGVDDMIEELPEGYDTLLGRMFGEYTLSGGQWQKIAIARAFARNSTLLILDEPTSNLDAQSEYNIFSSFRKLAHGRTTILISHRFSTVSMADRIIVLDKGEIVECGTHEELLLQGGLYATLYNLHQRQSAYKAHL